MNNIFDSVISEDLEQAGGDPSKVDFVELAFSDIVPQLEAGFDRIYGPFSVPVEDLSIGA